jgi:hypothetical protein
VNVLRSVAVVRTAVFVIPWIDVVSAACVAIASFSSAVVTSPVPEPSSGSVSVPNWTAYVPSVAIRFRSSSRPVNVTVESALTAAVVIAAPVCTLRISRSYTVIVSPTAQP